VTYVISLSTQALYCQNEVAWESGQDVKQPQYATLSVVLSYSVTTSRIIITLLELLLLLL